ncbi:sulfurtransferase TusA family protein [Aequoribacter sp.]|uniref:sulfurtransferase TusA family protein n=1 Tax=Aequoribacter sp. TaxID=2847771 RepID=UPI003F6A2D56
MQIDARGLWCPEPIMLLHRAVGDLDAGQEISLLTTDPAALRDVPKFCRFLGFNLASQVERGDHMEFVIRIDG